MNQKSNTCVGLHNIVDHGGNACVVVPNAVNQGAICVGVHIIVDDHGYGWSYLGARTHVVVFNRAGSQVLIMIC